MQVEETLDMSHTSNLATEVRDNGTEQGLTHMNLYSSKVYLTFKSNSDSIIVVFLLHVVLGGNSQVVMLRS